MSADITTLPVPPRPAPAAPLDLEALSKERAQLVTRLRLIDETMIRQYERVAAELENISQHIVATTLSVPTLPPATLDVARQTAAWLPPMVQRVVQMFARQPQPEPPEAA